MKNTKALFAIAAVTLITVAVGFGTAQAGEHPPDADSGAQVEHVYEEGTPAEECPEAMAELKPYGYQDIDSFHPGCPTPEQIQEIIAWQHRAHAVEAEAKEARHEAGLSISD